MYAIISPASVVKWKFSNPDAVEDPLPNIPFGKKRKEKNVNGAVFPKAETERDCYEMNWSFNDPATVKPMFSNSCRESFVSFSERISWHCLFTKAAKDDTDPIQHVHKMQKILSEFLTRLHEKFLYIHNNTNWIL